MNNGETFSVNSPISDDESSVEEVKSHPRVFAFGAIFGLVFSIFLSWFFINRVALDEESLLRYANLKPYLLQSESQFDFLLRNNSSLDLKVSGSSKSDLFLRNGDDLFSLIYSNGFSVNEVKMAIDAMRESVDFRSLKSGQKFEINYNFDVFFEPNVQQHNSYVISPNIYNRVEKRTIKEIKFKDSSGNKINVSRNKNGSFNVDFTEVKLINETRVISGSISTNLFTDVLSSGVKIQTLYQVLNEYAFIIDFQRDIRKGDKFLFVLNTMRDSDGEIRSEKIMFARLVLSGSKNEIYNFNGEFYSPTGESIRKGLLKSPVDGARISSGFSKSRKHPILGYSRAHLGVDFAVPIGTPVYSAGDGVITHAGWKGAYGKLVIVKHNAEYSTYYAHLSKINVAVGQRVKQRSVVGKVGMTGLATGPHLHYEVAKYGVKINPKLVKATASHKLDKKYFDKFNEYKDTIGKAISSKERN